MFVIEHVEVVGLGYIWNVVGPLVPRVSNLTSNTHFCPQPGYHRCRVLSSLASFTERVSLLSGLSMAA